MSTPFLEPYILDLEALGRANRRRVLTGRAGADFSSNDYLGLSGSERLKAAVERAMGSGSSVGACGSRLLRGNDPEHEALEAEAAAFFGTGRALYFISGYMANLAIFATLPQRGDLVVYDELIHASAHDGLKLGRAQVAPFRHNDPAAAEAVIRHWRTEGGTGRPWIAVESLYSMDGDRASLQAFKAVADMFEGGLIIDEAHATGVFGRNGQGLCEGLSSHENVITLHTCGKALGVAGALVTAPAAVCDFIVNRSRGFIFSTAPSPLMAAAVRESLRILEDEPWRRERIAALIAHAEHELSAKLGLKSSGSQIQPIVIGDDGRTMDFARRLQDRGFDIRGIRPPTVPKGTSRLRLAITLNTNEKDISAIAEALAELQATAPA